MNPLITLGIGTLITIIGWALIKDVQENPTTSKLRIFTRIWNVMLKPVRHIENKNNGTR